LAFVLVASMWFVSASGRNYRWSGEDNNKFVVSAGIRSGRRDRASARWAHWVYRPGGCGIPLIAAGSSGHESTNFCGFQ